MRSSVKVFDTECSHDMWMLKFRDIDTKHVDTFTIWPGSPPLNIFKISRIMETSTCIGFNSKHYDIPMIALALTGADTVRLKEANDRIIPGNGLKGLMEWEFFDLYHCDLEIDIDHIDLYEVVPGVRISLKTYMGAINSRWLKDLPFDPNARMSAFGRVETSVYCENDLEGTDDLYHAVIDRIQLREALNIQYNTNPRLPFDARSKSDAQIAEAVFKNQLSFKPEKPFVAHGTQFNYVAPSFISFKDPELRKILDLVQAHPFIVSDKDQADPDDDDYDAIKTAILIPPAIKAARPRIGKATYKFGIGGLHSQEKKISHFAVDGALELSDHDVASFYPSLILMMKMFPPEIGPEFLGIYRAIYNQRLEAKANASKAKKAGDKATEKHWKTIADGLKIVLNGTFGKLGSKWSILFSPSQMIQVTITGQLVLLMLIEMLEAACIEVVSANTDGIVLRTPDGMQWLRDKVIAQWEAITGMQTEATQYKSMHIQNVNSYIAIKTDDEIKSIGLYGEPGITHKLKIPARPICSDAVIAYVSKGTPIEQTVWECRDVTRFLTVRNVKGGAYKPTYSEAYRQAATMGEPRFDMDPDEKEYIGKVVRYYYGQGERFALNYFNNGNKVANSDGAVPLMVLDGSLPRDVDYDRYIAEANKMLIEIGMT